MSIELDGMPLTKHFRDPETGATREIRAVYNIGVSEKRNIVEHRIPGLEGGVLQDLGREPVRISFEGILYGETAKEDLESIRSRFKAGASVPFSSDISSVADVTQVLIEDFQIEDAGGMVNRYKYRMTLRESSVPPEEEEPAPSQEEEAKKDVEEKTDDAKASVNYITGKVLDEAGNPKEGISVKIAWDAGEYAVRTNEDGVYRKDDLEPGKYTVTIDAPSYEGIEREVEIKSSEK
ncbi:MAG: carboxypeptidase regulatory-like domain-containing protein [Candidatus Bathyarchaeota archaeon]|nr:carboxypeptidase regulatory-like domain-containing protein [Candidatus Bathyarchaeota archaeon]